MRKTACCVVLLALLLICSIQVRAADTDSISAKSDDGAYLALDNGSEWLVAKADRKTSASWSTGDDVVAVDSSNSCSATELINADESNEAVCAVDASGDTSSITDKSDDGAYISLDDGPQWIVDNVDTSTSITWIEGDDVIALADSRFCTHVELVNTDEDGDEVCASAVHHD